MDLQDLPHTKLVFSSPGLGWGSARASHRNPPITGPEIRTGYADDDVGRFFASGFVPPRQAVPRDGLITLSVGHRDRL